MTKKYQSLTESYYYILLCLYKSPNHGYGIMQEASEYEIYTDKTSYSELLSKRCKLERGCLVLLLIFSLIYAYLAIRERSILLAVEDLVFWGIISWLKKGLNIMNKKIEENKF